MRSKNLPSNGLKTRCGANVGHIRLDSHADRWRYHCQPKRFEDLFSNDCGWFDPEASFKAGSAGRNWRFRPMSSDPQGGMPMKKTLLLGAALAALAFAAPASAELKFPPGENARF